MISLDTFLAGLAHSNCSRCRSHSLLGVGWGDGFTYLPRLPAWTRIAKNALGLPCWVMPLLSPGVNSPLRPDFRQVNHGSPLPGDTLRCKRSPVVPEYQPDVHRLRRAVLGLGPTNPERTSLPQETLGLRRVGFSPTLRYSCRHSHSRTLQPSLRSTFTASGTLPYRPRSGEPDHRPVASVPGLSPVGSSARNHLTSELLRTLSMMAASKPTSWLSVHLHILYH